jgi:D-alanyl-D-alanine dipeptidase
MTLLHEISAEDDGVLLDMRYASGNNFTGAPIYSRPGCYLNEEACSLMRRAVDLAGRLGYRLKVFDAFRPSEAAWALWNHTPNPEFLADPRRGSPHSRGAAIDLTLVDREGRELEMGTEFDAMTPRSHHGATDIPELAQQNRFLLLGIMTSAGWDFYRNEWWHYQLFAPRRFPVLSDKAAGTRMMPAT